MVVGPATAVETRGVSPKSGSKQHRPQWTHAELLEQIATKICAWKSAAFCLSALGPCLPLSD